MKVLVTGATGFIGNYVIQELLKQGFEVIATSSSLKNAKTKNWFSDVSYKKLNLKELNPTINYYDYFNQPDCLIHLAWEGLPNYMQEFHIIENLPRHQFFIENLIKNGLKNINIIGTCLEYGMQEGELSETMPANPQNPYAIAKNELRLFIEALSQKYTFTLKWIRLFYMYGKGQSEKSILSQLQKAIDNKEEVFNMSGGEQLRDYLSVAQIANNIVRISLQEKVHGIINNCSGKPISIKHLVLNYLQHQGNPKINLNFGFYPYTSYEPMSFWGNVEKLNKIL